MPRRRSYPAHLLLSLALFSTSSVEGSRTPAVVIITNPATPIQEISAEDLKSIFLKTKISVKGATHVEPVVEKSGPAHATFLKSYLGKTDSALQTYYRSLVFSGQGSMPMTVSSDAEVVAFVEKTRGAIGYVDSSADIGSVKTIRVR